MDKISELVVAVASMPSDRLVMIVVLAAIGLAGFAIYAVHSIAKGKDR